MKHEKIVDLNRQLVDLFARENMVAFFTFQWLPDQPESIQGLCKIAEPKQGEAKAYYLSLLFIIDAVDETREAKIDALMKGIAWGELKKYLQGIDMVIPMPHVRHDTGHYLQEVEVYFAPGWRTAGAYMADDLYLALQKLLGCRGGELLLWDERSPGEQGRPDEPHVETNRSLMDQIIRYFKAK